MRRIFLILFLLCVGTLHAAYCDQHDVWRFTDQVKMEQAILQYKDNPRATYYIIMRAFHQKLAPQATVIYRNLVKEDTMNAKLLSAYAFSHFLSTGPMSTSGLSYNAPELVRKLRGQQAEADEARSTAISIRPDLPEVLIETAIPLAHSGMWTPSNTSSVTASLYARKAVKLAPKWADAHYWLAYLLDQRWAMNSKAANFGHEMIQEIQIAEKLEPNLHVECLYEYFSAYIELDQPARQLEYLDAYIQARPESRSNKILMQCREQVAEQARKRFVTNKTASGSKP